MLSKTVLAAAALALVGGANALELPTFIADNMVLARAPLKPRLWGKGTAGETVVVTLNGNVSWKAVADSKGDWLLDIGAQETSKLTDSEQIGDSCTCGRARH